jgi:hypothetical protein
MKADGLTPETPEERAQFWMKKCKEAEAELLREYEVEKTLRQTASNLCGVNQELKEKITETNRLIDTVALSNSEVQCFIENNLIPCQAPCARGYEDLCRKLQALKKVLNP